MKGLKEETGGRKVSSQHSLNTRLLQLYNQVCFLIENSLKAMAVIFIFSFSPSAANIELIYGS